MTDNPEQIEQQLDSTRARLSGNLNELSDRMTLGHLLDEAGRYFDTGPKEFAAVLGRQVRQNPLATIITGAGLAWLAYGSRQTHQDSTDSTGLSRSDDDIYTAVDDASRPDIDRYSQLEMVHRQTSRNADESDNAYYRRLDDAYADCLTIRRDPKESDESYRDRIRSAVDAARERGRDALERAKRSADSAKRKARETGQQAVDLAGTAKQKAETFHSENPLAAGALAVAVGAIAGSLFPVSRREQDALKPVVDNIIERGAGIAEQTAGKIEKANRQIREKADEFKSEARG